MKRDTTHQHKARATFAPNCFARREFTELSRRAPFTARAALHALIGALSDPRSTEALAPVTVRWQR
ncbi:hypothetical protein [Deinococcus yavapaiensis]|uniref:Uncharacterized protein n=1 Tax=Deinococcus yavapaiensis KR-236 TaxID=694435 RepID=A0A318SAH1_9DEIO|nr:hypothetical protein [Deinococcus yavapaiensis]PYE56410.1 hypothetical protein DES52_101214 [Deinococcus yavapaiensis KR-236]